MEKRWITILCYETGEINIYELSGEVLDKYYELSEEAFIREIIGCNLYEIEWMITTSEPFITNEVLTLN